MSDKLGRFVKGHPKPKNAYKFPKGNPKPRNAGAFLKGHVVSEETRKKIGNSNAGKSAWNKGMKFPDLSGKNSPRWKGGKTTGSDGSVLIRKPNHPHCNKSGYILEHRIIVENHIKRFLTPKEVVHHVNEIRNDNRPENLMAFVSDIVHHRFHKNPNNVKPSEIIFDGRLINALSDIDLKPRN